MGGLQTIGSEDELSLAVLLVTPDMTGGGGRGLKDEVADEVLEVVLAWLENMSAAGTGMVGGGGRLVN